MTAAEIIACIDRWTAWSAAGVPKPCIRCGHDFTPPKKSQSRAKYCETCRKTGVYYKMRYNPKSNGSQRLRAAGYDVTRKKPGRR